MLHHISLDRYRRNDQFRPNERGYQAAYRHAGVTTHAVADAAALADLAAAALREKGVNHVILSVRGVEARPGQHEWNPVADFHDGGDFAEQVRLAWGRVLTAASLATGLFADLFIIDEEVA